MTELITFIKWLIDIYENPKKESTLEFWGRGADVYIDGILVVTGDDKWHHVAIVNKGESAIMTSFDKKTSS